MRKVERLSRCAVERDAQLIRHAPKIRGAELRGIDRGEDILERALQGIRCHPRLVLVVLGVGIAQDVWQQLRAEVQLRLRIERGDCGPEAGQRGLRWQRVVLRLRDIGVAAAGGDDKVRFLAVRLIAQAGAGRGVLHELAAPVDGEQRHDVEETHAQTADQDLLARRNLRHRLLHGVIRAHPVQAGIRSFGQRALGFVQGRYLPAIGQDGGVGGDGGAVGKLDGVLLTAPLHGQRAGAVLDDVHVLWQLRQRNLENPLQVGAVERTGGVGFRAGLRELFGKRGSKPFAWRVGIIKLQLGRRDVGALAAQKLNPLIEDGAFKYRRGGRGAGLGKQRDRASQRVHAQRAGLLRIPNATSAQRGIVDDVEAQG